MNSTDSFVDRYIASLQTFNSTYWPHTLKIEVCDVFAAERFCYQHFKTKNWRNKGTMFAFKRKEDYEWFLLRWS